MTPTRSETTKKKYQISINVSDTKFHLILMFFFIHILLLYIYFFDWSTFSDFLFTPSKTNKQKYNK